MKRLIVCCDGTWNNPEQEDNGIPAPTNVFKIFNAVSNLDSDNQIAQSTYYHPGVGGEGGILKPIVGGAFGVGVSRHICSAYHWLGSHYQEGDEIYLFGFSRGAFIVRSLAGFLGKGLLNLQELNSEESWHRVHQAFKEGYRTVNSSNADWAEPGWGFFHEAEAAPVHFIGVWDTVGALGIPDDLEFFNMFDDKSKWEFFDTDLGDHVQHARHAMALDEIRSSFTVTRWANAELHDGVKEVWFPGVHSDVGGGYAEKDLSDGALQWMIDQAEEQGLVFRPGVQERLNPQPLGVIHNSYKGAFAKLRSRPRNIPAMVPGNRDMFHSSAMQRQVASPIEHPAYHPTRILNVGESAVVDVFADQHWCRTGLYLEQGHQYLFSASGEWIDGKDNCDWKGTQDERYSAGDIVRGVSTFLGTFESLFKKATHNQSTDFWGTKRVESMDWFCLVGAITNDGGVADGVKNDGSPTPHQYVSLSEYTASPLAIGEPGYLYCFPNDAWSFYGNNHGSIQLTVERVG